MRILRKSIQAGHPSRSDRASDVKPGILERHSAELPRFTLDQYINLRPVKLYEGVETLLKDKGPE